MIGDLDDILQPGESAILPEETQGEAQGEIQAPQSAAEPPSAEPQPDMVPRAALIAERKKRQQYEQQLRQQPQPQFDPGVFHQDPASIMHYVDQRLAQDRVSMSRGMAATMYDDYAEMEELFIEEAERNPALVYELNNADNPAVFAYRTAKALKDYRAAQSGDLRKQIRMEVEAEIRAELGQKKPAVNVPPDLSATRSVGLAEPPVDESLEAILRKG